jgi:hypothetical protein
MRNIILILICLSLCSCASSDRMMKISPFSQSRDMPDSERMNLWPLAYKNQDAVSLLWPIVDYDKEGFAVRPLINKEKANWSILFPLSGWNTTHKQGWLLTAYHTSDVDGLFPLYHLGDDDFNYVFPVWWNDEEEHGALLLYGWLDDWRHIGPAWWRVDDTAYGLFPLFERYNKETYSRFTIGQGMFVNWKNKKDGAYNHWVAPVWYSEKDSRDTTQLLLPLYLKTSNDKESMFLTPLGGRAWTKDETTMVNVGGPLYHCHRNGEHLYKAFAWPIFTWSNDGNWRVWPLYSRSTEKSGGPLHKLVLLHTTDTDKHKEVSCLAPLIFDYDRYVSDDGKVNTSFDFLLFGSIYDRHYNLRHVPPPSSSHWHDMVRSRGKHFVLAYHRKSYFRDWNDEALSEEDQETLFNWANKYPYLQKEVSTDDVVKVLTTKGVKPASNDKADIDIAITEFVSKNTHEYEKDTVGIPILFKRNTEPGKADWKVLFGAMKGQRNDERSHFSVLKMLYRRDREGDAISRDIFPFVAWDTAPDSGRFTFLWRVINIRKTEEGAKGHLLFIPFGED